MNLRQVSVANIPRQPGLAACQTAWRPGATLCHVTQKGTNTTNLLTYITRVAGLLFLALYHALRRESQALALFESALGILGLVVLAAAALPHIAQALISDLSHAPGTTPEEQAPLVFLWQATQGILDAMFVTGLVFLPIGLVCLGVAMLWAPAFGTRFDGMVWCSGLEQRPEAHIASRRSSARSTFRAPTINPRSREPRCARQSTRASCTSSSACPRPIPQVSCSGWWMS